MPFITLTFNVQILQNSLCISLSIAILQNYSVINNGDFFFFFNVIYIRTKA